MAHTVRTCTIKGCDRKHQARGYCSTHYNQLIAPDRHAKVQVPCANCGTPTWKHKSNSKKRRPTCSNECRTQITLGYCTLPPDHPARWYGATCAWKPKPPKFQPEQRKCKWCGIEFTAVREPNVHCSHKCSKKASKRRRRAREAGAQGEYSWAEVIALFLAGGKRCAYCDQHINGEPEPDHVIPISRGGTNNTTNLLPSCHTCNADKGDMTPYEWRADRQRRDKPPVRTEFDWHEPRFKHLVLGIATGESHRLWQAKQAA